MKKSKIVLTVIGVVALIIVAVILFLLLAGFRFTSKSACAECWRDEPVIETDDFDFYIFSWTDENGNDVMIDHEAAIQKYGFLYKPVECEIRRLVTSDGKGGVGTLKIYEGNDRYYYFIHYAIGPSSMKYETDRITLSGEEIELVQMSYFTTEEPVTEFEINGVTVLVGEPI